MDHLKLLKVATRMLFDVITVMEKEETDFEIGCKAKSLEIADSLKNLLSAALADCPVQVIVKDESIVVITPQTSSSSSSQQCLPAQTPLPPSPPSPSRPGSPSSQQP